MKYSTKVPRNNIMLFKELPVHSYSYKIYNEHTRSQPYEKMHITSSQSTQVSAAPPAYEKNGCIVHTCRQARRALRRRDWRRRHVIGPSHPRSYFRQRTAWTFVWMVTLSVTRFCSLLLLDQGGNVVSGLHGGGHRIIEVIRKRFE